MRSFFKTTKVHHCFNQEFNIENGVVHEMDLQPKKCKCRKFISKQVALNLVQDGVADWIIKDGQPTYDVVLRGIAGKTPRAQTIEKAHMQRYIDGLWNAGNAVFDDPETMMHLEVYHDIEMENRLKLFHVCGVELIQQKRASDNFGVIEGAAGKVLSDKIIAEADDLKVSNAIDDPFIGESIFMAIGSGNQRTVIGRDVTKDEMKLDKS